MLPGDEPSAPLAIGDDGNLYGLTASGGTADAGTVFRLLPGASPTVEPRAQFTGTAGSLPGSSRPLAELVRGQDGNLHGTTTGGGSTGSGTVFTVVPGGGVISRVSFTGYDGAFPGAVPLAPLSPAPDGNLYGTTSTAGTGGGGSLFRLFFGPTVLTAAATDVSFTRVMFNASINPNDSPSEVWFEYGTTEQFGRQLPKELVLATARSSLPKQALDWSPALSITSGPSDEMR